MSACNGEEGLARFSATQPELVILDVMMPKTNGFQVCRKIRELDPDVPVIILSAKGDIVDKGEGFEAGATDYLVKPFDPQELILRVRLRLGKFKNLPLKESGFLKQGAFEIDIMRHEVTVAGAKDRPRRKGIPGSLPACAEFGGSADQKADSQRMLGRLLRWRHGHAFRVHKELRQKIETDPSHPVYLKTIKNVGYQLDTR